MFLSPRLSAVTPDGLKVDVMVEDFFSIIDIEEIGNVPLTMLAWLCTELSRQA